MLGVGAAMSINMPTPTHPALPAIARPLFLGPGLASGEAGVPPQELGSTVVGGAGVSDQLVYPDACTDVHLLDAERGVSMWGHNEDGDATLGYVLEMNMAGEEGTSYTGLCYAGCLCGWAWAYNEHGIVTTINALTPSKACSKGDAGCWHGRFDRSTHRPPRHAASALSAIAHSLLLSLASGLGLGVTFVSRDCLEASGLDDAIARASVGGQGGGLHFNLASTSSPHVHWGVETSPVGSSAVQFPRGLAYHCNAYLHDTLVQQGAEGRTGPFLDSSTYRQSRVEARSEEHSPTVDMTPSSAKAFVLGTIGDNADSSYPIYRSGAPPDYGYVPVRPTHVRGAQQLAIRQFSRTNAPWAPGLRTIRW